MIDFNIKLRNNYKKINLKELDSNSLKIKFLMKGLYKDIKFKAEVSFIIYINKNTIKINKLSIKDLDIFESESSSNYLCNNIYTLSTYEIINSEKENEVKKIYKCLKSFIDSIKINKNHDRINSVVFDLTDNKISKINLRGYARNYNNI